MALTRRRQTSVVSCLWGNSRKYFSTMSNSHRRDRYSALVAIAGILAIVFVAWLNQPPGSQIREPNPEPPQAEGDDRKPLPKRVYWGLFTADDSIAQWFMALFTVVATGVSLKAVFLVRDTLELNRKATDAALKAADHAATANAIMRQEQRPWVTFEREIECCFMDEGVGGLCVWYYRLVNHGKLPALKTGVHSKLIRHRKTGFEHFRQYGEFVKNFKRKNYAMGGNVVFPGPSGRVQNELDAHYESDGDTFALAICVTYATQDGLGLDCRLFDIENNSRFPTGPRVHRLIEYASYRIVE